jgi:hypothetical protein
MKLPMYKTLSIFVYFFLFIIVSKHIYVLAAFLYYRLFVFVFFSTLVFFSKNRFSHSELYVYVQFWLSIDWKHHKRPFFLLIFMYYTSTCNLKISFILLLLLYYICIRDIFCFSFLQQSLA